MKRKLVRTKHVSRSWKRSSIVTFMNTWEMESITSVPKLLAAVSEFLPLAQTASFEIHNACQGARKIYGKHHSSKKFRPLRDTILPRTQLHYCTISKALANDLAELLRSHEIK